MAKTCFKPDTGSLTGKCKRWLNADGDLARTVGGDSCNKGFHITLEQRLEVCTENWFGLIHGKCFAGHLKISWKCSTA